MNRSANLTATQPSSSRQHALPTMTRPHHHTRWRFDRFAFDPARRELVLDGRRRLLEDKLVTLLLCLLEHADQVVDRHSLRQLVWPGQVVTDGAIAKAVMKLRAALGPDSERLLLTVHGIGYRLAVHATCDRIESEADLVRLEPGAAMPQRPNWFVHEHRGADRAGERWHVRHGKTGEIRLLQLAAEGSQASALLARLQAHRRLLHALPRRHDLARLVEADERSLPMMAEFSVPSEHRLDDPLPRQWLEAQSTDQRLALAMAVIDALAAAHSVGIGHGELSPEQIYVGLSLRSDTAGTSAEHGIETFDDPLPMIVIVGLAESGINVGETSDDAATFRDQASEDVRRLGLLLFQLLVCDLDARVAPGWERRIDDTLLCEDIAAACNDDPSMRPRDAGELAAALRALPQRHQQRAMRAADQALLARQQRALARARQRRRWAVALLAGMSVFTVTSLHLLQQARQAHEQALSAQASTEAINQFLIHDLIRQAEPFYGRGADVRLVDLLAPAEAGIAARFGDQPEVAARISRALGQIRLGLGEWDHAETLLANSLALAGAHWPPGHPERAATQFELGDLLVRRARFANARALYLDVLAVQEQRFGRNGADTLWTRTQLAWLDHELGDSASAAAALEAIVQAAQTATEPDQPLIDLAEHYLALTETELGRWDTAQQRYLDLRTRVSGWRGEDHPAVAQIARNLGALWVEMGKTGAAIELLQEALASMSERLERNHPEVIALEAELGTALLEHGQFERALPILAAAGDNRRSLLGIGHDRTRHTLSRLTQALHQTGEHDQAAALAAEIVTASDDHLGPEHPESALFRFRHAELLAELGDVTAARTLIESAWQATEQRYGAAHPRSLAMRLALIELDLAGDRLDHAQVKLAALPSEALTALPEQHPIRRTAERIHTRLNATAAH